MYKIICFSFRFFQALQHPQLRTLLRGLSCLMQELGSASASAAASGGTRVVVGRSTPADNDGGDLGETSGGGSSKGAHPVPILVIRKRLLVPFSILATHVLLKHSSLLEASNALMATPLTSSSLSSNETAQTLCTLFDVITVALCMEASQLLAIHAFVM